MNEKIKAAREARAFAGQLRTLLQVADDLEEIGKREATCEALDKRIGNLRKEVEALKLQADELTAVADEQKARAETVRDEMLKAAGDEAAMIVKEAEQASEEKIAEWTKPIIDVKNEQVDKAEKSVAEMTEKNEALQKVISELGQDKNSLTEELEKLRRNLKLMAGG